MIFPETYAKNANARRIIVLVPAAKPSIPSVILAPFETAVTINMTTGIIVYSDFSSTILTETFITSLFNLKIRAAFRTF